MILKKIWLITCLLLLSVSVQAQQQMENTMSQYFRNRILWNAAYTGIDGSKLYALQNRSWLGFEAAPVVTSFSGEFGFGKNSAAGLQVVTDRAGVIYRTMGALNYAYKIDLGKSQILRMGVSMSFEQDRLNNKALDGPTPDPAVVNNLNSKLRFDGGFGAVYQKDKLDIGLSFIRLERICVWVAIIPILLLV